MNCHVRPATLADQDVLVRHRIGMFTGMGVPVNAQIFDPAFRRWLAEMFPAGTYRAWLVETDAGEILAGGGISIIPWPPHPEYLGNRLAFVYNVYTEPAHRHQGHGRRIMETIHDWCRGAGIASVALNASRFAQPLYESMGYRMSASPMMVLGLE